MIQKDNMKLTKEQIEKASKILTSITKFKMNGYPIPPLKSDDAKLVNAFLREKFKR